MPVKEQAFNCTSATPPVILRSAQNLYVAGEILRSAQNDRHDGIRMTGIVVLECSGNAYGTSPLWPTYMKGVAICHRCPLCQPSMGSRLRPLWITALMHSWVRRLSHDVSQCGRTIL